MKIIQKLLVAFVIIVYIQCAQKVTDLNQFKEHMDSIASSPYSRQRVKYIYFELNKSKIHNVQYFSSMLEDFLLTINIRGTVYNIEDRLLIAMVPTSSEVDTNFLMNHFEEAFSRIFIRYPG